MVKRPESTRDSADLASVDSRWNGFETNFRQIVDSIPVPVAITTPTGEVETLNGPTLEYFGKTLGELKGWQTSEAIHPDDLQRTISVFLEAHEKGLAYEVESRHRRADGTYRWFNVHGLPLRDAQGKILRWFHLLVDIDDRKKAEEKVRDSERNLNEIINTIPAHIYVLNTEGSVQHVNQAVMDYTGLTMEDVQQEDYRDRVIHPEDFKKVRAPRAAGLRRGAPFTTEQRVLGSDGQYRWFLVHYKPLLDEQKRIIRWYVAAFDIEDRKHAEAERQQIAETFRTIVETNPECVKIIDSDGTLQRVNAAGLVMSGAPSEEAILGQCFYDFVAPQDRDRYREFNEKVCSGHKGFLEFDLINAHGELHHMETHAAPMLNGDGSVVQLGVTRDITERKLTLQRLQANQDLLELAQKSAGAMAFDWYIQEDINHWSPEQESLFGLAPGTFDGTYQSWKSMIYAPDWPKVVEAIQLAHETGVVEAEFRVLNPDGPPRWLATNGRMFFDDEGKPFRMVGFSSDVTRRKIVEMQLAGEKQLLEMVATGRLLPDILTSLCTYVEDIAPDCHCGVYLIDWDGPTVQLSVGPTLPAEYNAALEGLHITPETGPCALAACERIQVIAADVESDSQWQSSPFRTVALAHGLRSCWSTPIFSQAGQVLGTFAIYQHNPATPTPLQQDLIAQVTHIASIAIERSQREEALRRSEAFLAESQDLARIGSFAWNVATNKITWSEQLYRIYGFEPGGPITLELIRTRVHPDDISLYEKMKEQQGFGGKDFEWEYRLLMPDKSIKHLCAIAHASRNHRGEVEYIAAVQDVTARKASEEALRRRELELRRANQYLTIAQELSQTGSYARDVATDEQTLSDEMYRIMDFDPAKKVTQEMVLGRIHPEDVEIVDAAQRVAIEAGEDFEAAFRIVTGSGAVKHLRSVSRRVAEITDRLVYVGATQDVTEKKLAEEALDQARSDLAHVSRITTLGALTASIAHEVNQPLSGIITNASTCLRMLAAEPPRIEGALETAKRIVRDGHRASDVITRLRSLFGKKEVMSDSINLNDAAEEVITLSRRELQANRVLLKQEFSDDLPVVMGDRIQLQQVILNLLLNASHAMVDIEDRPRELLIRTQHEAEDCVLLAVTDTGIGFDPQNKDKLFEAFYTTKKSGMGIGLHVSRSIIENHHGRLWATRNDGPGATFSFTIPRAV